MIQLFSINLSKNRLYGLDILRALAILFVVIEHGQYILPPSLKTIHNIIIFDGVSIFFVLSGFLIGGILIKLLDKNKPTKKLIIDFWIRRWFRTLPNYFLILFLLIGFSFAFDSEFSILQTKRYFIFAQNLFHPHPHFFPEAWSLSIEEWFYLITPICIFSLMHFFNIKSKNAILIIAISVLFMVLLFRFIKYSSVDIKSHYEWDLLFRKQVFTRLDSLMFGVISAYIQYYMNIRWLKNKKKLFIAGLIIFIINKTLFLQNVITYTGFYSCVISFSVTSIATAFLLPYLSDLKSGTGIIYKGITTVSLISYSMYLLNLSVIQTNIINKIPWTGLNDNIYIIVFLKYNTYWILTIFGSILIYKFFEVPTTRLRENNRVKRLLVQINGSI
ncbi:acyltransferase family protein [Saccharicrinis sp. FJH54]|uniref:acyltransferase family protein n=1 Tax=Saccharicrinis sp. FJH54 TaxID=3344665 RepID=UPI0035D3E932